MLQTISAAWSAAMSAVTSQIQDYFTTRGRLRSQYTIPALAFLLGCLALLMAILGPDLLRAWWEGLDTDLKLLAMGLGGLLFILFAEVGRHLTLTVRRIYAGELPRSAWWQRSLRKPYLKDSISLDEEVRILKQAESELNAAQDILKQLTPDTVDEPVRARYPVPRSDIGTYQLITPDDWEWQSLPQKEVPEGTFVKSPTELLGRYAVAPLAARQPVLAGRLRTVPLGKYLRHDERRILTLDVYRMQTGPHLEPGTVVDLYLIPRRGKAEPCKFSDILVLDRPSPGEAVLSVRDDDAGKIVKRLPTCCMILSRSPETPKHVVMAVPVAKETLAPGQLIQEKHVTWRLVLGPQPLGGTKASHEDEVLNHVYWPWAESGLQGPPQNPGPSLDQGHRFDKENLAKVPDPGWLTYTEDGRTKFRLAYKLVLEGMDQKGGQAGRFSQDDGREIEVEIVTLPGAEADQPITDGDRLAVTFQKPNSSTAEELWCYVYKVNKRDGGPWDVYIAVKDRVAFHDNLMAADKVSLSPFCRVPVLKSSRKPGELIPHGPAHVTTADYRANEQELLGGMCLSIEEVEDHYVKFLPDRVLEAYRPVPQARLGATWPDDWELLRLSAGEDQRITVSKKESDLQRGVLVNVRLRGLTGNGGRLRFLPWRGAFVHTVSRATNGDSTELVLAVPKEKKPLAEDLWSRPCEAEITVTHADSFIKERQEFLTILIPTDERMLAELNWALTPGNLDAAALKERAETLKRPALARKKMALELRAMRSQLDERPWQGDAPPQNYSHKEAERAYWKDLVEPLEETVEVWLRAIRHLQETRRRGAQLTMPDNLSDTRPTEFGNVLAAAFEYPFQAYGLDTASVLPRLLHVLDLEDSEVKRLMNAEASMNMLLLFSFWAGVWTLLGTLALFVGLATVGGTWWMFPVVLVGGPLIWLLTREAATAQAYSYGEALKSLFDLKRRRLFRAIGLTDLEGKDLEEKEMTPKEEQEFWKHLYSLLAHGNTEAKDFPKLKPGSEVKGE